MKITEMNIEELVKEEGMKVLESDTWYNKETKCYEDEIYIDYRDEQDLKDHLLQDLKELINTENVNDLRDALFDNFYELFDDQKCDMYYEIANKIIDNVADRYNEEEKELNEYHDSDEMIEEVQSFLDNNNYVIEEPYDFYFNKAEIGFNIVVDTGDGNYDYTLNSIRDYEEPELEDESSILWLIRQQGYNWSDMKDAHENKNKFLESIEDEIINETTSMNALTFFVKMTLNKYLDLREKLEAKEDVSIIVPKTADCGLVDYWNGAGGLLNIALEKDVVIPEKFIGRIDLDNNIGQYGVSEIYGYPEEYLWETEIKVS